MKWAFFLMLMIASTATAEIYTWSDGRGVAHYTNSLHEVPTRYREKIKVLNLGLEQKDQGTGASSAPAEQATLPHAATPPVQNPVPEARSAQPAPSPRLARKVRQRTARAGDE